MALSISAAGLSSTRPSRGEEAGTEASISAGELLCTGGLSLGEDCASHPCAQSSRWAMPMRVAPWSKTTGVQSPEVSSSVFNKAEKADLRTVDRLQEDVAKDRKAEGAAALDATEDEAVRGVAVPEVLRVEVKKLSPTANVSAGMVALAG